MLTAVCSFFNQCPRVAGFLSFASSDIKVWPHLSVQTNTLADIC